MALTASRLASPILALSLTAAGCTATRPLSGPIQTEATAPPSWGTAAQGTSPSVDDLSQWWEQFGDTTLTELVTTSLRANTDIRIAQARLRQARAQRGVAAAGLMPSVSGSASASDRTDSPVTLSSALDASWEPDIFGGTRAGVAAATADLRATAADLYATQVSLAAEVARNYADLRTQQARLDIARRNEVSQAETLQLTEFRAQAGLVNSVDVEQARTSVEQTRAQIPALESSIAQTMNRLATLAGLQPTALRDTLSTAAGLPVLPREVAVGIPASTLRQRPDVRAAEQRLLAETARLRQAETQRFPQLSLSGSLGLSGSPGTQITTGAVSAATGGLSVVSSLAASVFQTIFDGGRIRQQIEIQSAAQEQAVASYEASVLAALEDVENALVAFEKNRERLASLASAAAAAGTAAELARTQYQAGLTDFQRVLDTQRTVLSVEDTVAQAQGDRVTGLVQLFQALGGGWWITTAADILESDRP